MDITVKTNALKEQNGSTIAIANIDFGDQLKVRNVTVKEGKNGRFVAMPSYATNRVDEQGNTIYNEVFNPITAVARAQLNSAVLESLDSGKAVTIEDISQRTGKDITARVVPLEDGKAGAIGIGRLYLNEDYVVNNITIRHSEKTGDYVSFPSYKTNEIDESGQAVYKDFVYPPDRDSRAVISSIVMNAFRESKEIENSKPIKEVEDKEILKDEKPKGVKARLKEGAQKSKAAAKNHKTPTKSKEAAIE